MHPIDAYGSPFALLAGAFLAGSILHGFVKEWRRLGTERPCRFLHRWSTWSPWVVDDARMPCGWHTRRRERKCRRCDFENIELRSVKTND